MFLNLDGDILIFIQEHIRNAVCDPVFRAITHLGDAGIFWILLTAVFLCFKKTRKAGICSAAALIGSVVVNNLILKNLVGRVRPYEVVEGLKLMVKEASDASFPSGHSGASFASAVAIFPHVPKKWGVALIVLATLIAFSRLYIGIHYPTDVIAGIIIGIVLGILSNILIAAAYKKYGVEK